MNRKSDCLACRRFKGTHSYEKIAELLNEIISEYSIPMEKIVKGTCDNGTNFLKAFRVYGKTISSSQEVEEREVQSQEAPDPDHEDDNEPDDIEFHELSSTLRREKGLQMEDELEKEISLPPCHPCSSHTLNLVLTCSKVANRNNKLQRSSFGKCQGLWNAVSRSTKKCEAAVNVTGKAIVTPVITRWNSMYDAVKFLLSLEETLDEIFESVGKWLCQTFY